MNPIVTTLLYVVAPLAVLGALAVATMRPARRGSAYRTGDSWDHEPLWWIGNPRGSGVAAPEVERPTAAALHASRGGARGTW